MLCDTLLIVCMLLYTSNRIGLRVRPCSVCAHGTRPQNATPTLTLTLIPTTPCTPQVEYQGRTLYNCGVNNYPKDYTTDPACTPLPPSSLRDQLKLQRSVTEWPWEAVALVRPHCNLGPKSAQHPAPVVLRRAAA